MSGLKTVPNSAQATVSVSSGGTGATTASAARTNLGLNSVDNTSDADKPVSTATTTALNLKANLASPALTGAPSGVAVGSAVASADASGVKGTIRFDGDLLYICVATNTWKRAAIGTWGGS